MIGKIPDDLKASIDRYVETGCPTGGFLEACIDNNLSEAVGRADERNIRLLPEIVSYLYNHCPSGCWGKAGARKAWTEKKLKEGQPL